MNLHYLRVFHEVATSGSVTRAAERLCISQPAVSIQLRRLEGEVGLPLLEPAGRGIRLTPAGEMLASRARRLFALEAQMEAELADWRQGTAGRLRVGATNLLGHFLLPAWAAHFKQQVPQVDLSLRTANSRIIFDSLHEHAIELAFVAGGWAEPGIHREVLWREELCFVVPAGHRLAGQQATLAELAKEPFLLREEGSSTRQRLLALFELHGLHLQVGLAFAGMLEMIRAVEAGYGVALLPSLAVREQLARGTLGRVQVVGVDLPIPISLCMRE